MPPGAAARYAGVVFDLDGVLVRGASPIPHAAEAVAALRDAGVGVAFATNNATRTPEQVAALLAGAGVGADPAEVVTSPMAAARWLEPGTRCLVVGMEGVEAALDARGCPRVTDPADAQAVVVGLDTDLTYDDLRRGTTALLSGARFLATNADATLPTENGPWPGAGAIVAALAAASGRSPEVVGKPHAPLFEAAAAVLPDGPLLMVGDRLDTDIGGAAALGWDTALVLTGVATRADLRASEIRPTHVVETLAELAAVVGIGARAAG